MVGSGTTRDADDDFGLWLFFGGIVAVIALVVGLVWGAVHVARGTYHLVTDGHFVQSEPDLRGLATETYTDEITPKTGLLENPYWSSQSSYKAWFSVLVENDSGQPHEVSLTTGLAEIRAWHLQY